MIDLILALLTYLLVSVQQRVAAMQQSIPRSVQTVRYSAMPVLLYSIPVGIAHGLVWHRSGKITAGAITHATVNFVGTCC